VVEAAMRDASLNDVRLSIRSANLLANLGATTVAEAAALGEADILSVHTATPRTLREIRAVLRKHDADLSGPTRTTPRKPLAPRTDWGCLFVAAPRIDVEGAVAATYEALGLTRQSADEEQLIDEAEVNEMATLAADDVLILDDAPGWTAVASHRWELALPGAHPLALALAARVTVLSLADVAESHAEIAVYERGALRELSVVGPGASSEAPRAEPLAFERFGVPEHIDELRAFVTHAGVFANFAGLSCRGYVDAFEAAPLSDWGAQHLWVFA
jgi:hypothetical protein